MPALPASALRPALVVPALRPDGARDAPERRDTARVTTPVSAAADTGNAEDGPRLAFGGGVGALAYADGYRERLVALGARLRLVRGVTLSVHPGFANAAGFTTVTTGATGGTTTTIGTTPRRRRRGGDAGTRSGSGSVSGFTDLPVDLGAEHVFDALPGAPTLNAGYGVLLPTGNTRTVGAGEASGSVDVGVGVTPVDRVTADFGVGHYRAGTGWAIGGPGGTWGSAGVSVEVGRPLTLSLGLSGDLESSTAADQANVANGRSVDGAAALRLSGLPPLALEVHHAYAGTAPRWSIGIEVGGVGLPLTTLGRLGR